MRKPLRPHREGPTIVGGGSEVILTVLYDKRKRVTFWVTLINYKLTNYKFTTSACNFQGQKLSRQSIT